MVRLCSLVDWVYRSPGPKTTKIRKTQGIILSVNTPLYPPLSIHEVVVAHDNSSWVRYGPFSHQSAPPRSNKWDQVFGVPPFLPVLLAKHKFQGQNSGGSLFCPLVPLLAEERVTCPTFSTRPPQSAHCLSNELCLDPRAHTWLQRGESEQKAQKHPGPFIFDGAFDFVLSSKYDVMGTLLSPGTTRFFPRS